MAIKLHNPIGTRLEFDDSMMHIDLQDGRRISVPLEWFPRLRKANSEQLNDWRWIGGGIGIHWRQLDEDISIEGLLK